ncbi:MAG: hypothetical protein HC899_16745 [Leptolyngbyaceae cyanobacterium SM1_4_3]|nr:hypothetical protein [Leptolyngbyaceae cyanobacterium SM1_4_3]
MAQSYPLKNLRPSMQAFIRPMLFASLALHALVLLIPAPPQETPEPVEEEEQITLTQLPPVDQPAEQPSPRPATPAPPPRRTNAPAPRVRQSAPPPTRSSPRPQSSPGQTTTNSSNQAQANQVQANNAPPVDPFTAEFPKIYPGSEEGSYGLPEAYNDFSRRTTDGLSQVDRWFQTELAAKEFSFGVVEENSTGKVYQVTKDGVTRFLVIVSDPSGSGGTNYILSEQQLQLDELASASIVSPEEQSFYSDLSDILPSVNTNQWQEVDPQYDLPEPTAFYSDLGSVDSPPTPKPNLETAVVEIGSEPSAVFEELSRRFEVAYYEVGSPVSYGGGSLYEVSRDEGNGVIITRYLSLVSTGRGTAIFFWRESPI